MGLTGRKANSRRETGIKRGRERERRDRGVERVKCERREGRVRGGREERGGRKEGRVKVERKE